MGFKFTPSPVYGREVFIYCRKGENVWHVMRGTYGGVCVEVDAGFRTVEKDSAECSAMEYANRNADTFKGAYDANAVDADTVEVKCYGI